MIDIQNIDFSIKNRDLVRDISFKAKGGEFVAILGANGAGKSTLLRILNGEHAQTNGSVKLNGKLLQDFTANELARSRAVLEQYSQINMSFTVREIVSMGRYPHRKKSQANQDLKIVNNCMQEAGINQLANRIYNTLSGGEQQRVQLARVFAQISGNDNEECKFLFLDEPVNSLDIKYQHSTLQLARNFARSGNIAIAVLHDINLAVTYADKILLMKNGRQIAFGSPPEILTTDILSKCYDFDVQVADNPFNSNPLVYFCDPEETENADDSSDGLRKTEKGNFFNRMKKSREKAFQSGI